LADELRRRLIVKSATLPDAIKDLKIKISGCFNSCGQHHVADIGFFGNSRRQGNYKAPHFQVVLGGQWSENAASFGLAVGAVPAKNIPDVLDVITNRYVAEREKSESFQSWITRLGKKEVRAIIEPYMQMPVFELDPSYYSDWGDSRVYSIADIGVGECAGEVVSLFSMEIAKAESEHFDALIALDEGDYKLADDRAYHAMLTAARALVLSQYLNVGNDPNRIVQEFKARYYDTQLFFDKFARGKFAQYLFIRHENPPVNPNEDQAHQLVEEAQLFIEATHACEARVNGVIVS
jgi:sulfite reductase (ferredoxin)